MKTVAWIMAIWVFMGICLISAGVGYGAYRVQMNHIGLVNYRVQNPKTEDDKANDLLKKMKNQRMWNKLKPAILRKTEAEMKTAAKASLPPYRDPPSGTDLDDYVIPVRDAQQIKHSRFFAIAICGFCWVALFMAVSGWVERGSIGKIRGLD